VSRPSSQSETIYRYTDREGAQHFTTDRSSIPESRRDTVEIYQSAEPSSDRGKTSEGEVEGARDGPKLDRKLVEGLEQKGLDGAKKLTKEGLRTAKALTREALRSSEKLQAKVGEHVPLVADVHLPSAAFGFACAVGLVLVQKVFRSKLKILLKLAAIAVVLMLLAGGYLGALRKNAGLGGGESMTTPQQIVDDAKKASDLANDRIREQQKLLDGLEKDGR
jgi:hypothetical protein